MTKKQRKVLEDAHDLLKDFINAAGNGQPYTPEEVIELGTPVCNALYELVDPLRTTEG